ncbi:acyl-CoA thioester hydrolase [Dethiosulfatibacter aminovorans DSM 17477]|uniref:Acyl-CoA thioester hydrolase n=1 Tax=Dethiosulfatibacter aminovorans DSM 17477 TaxID=1121476 RepID=A0A1M6MEQ9_9FIRM|nr:thioesterase family protein [Dethiosulfatibacter aminovorans]SHJ81959.1 acyl-CoA thioester hydrolase [Dethiosulfatibacter aminovorans DSM 17477]
MTNTKPEYESFPMQSYDKIRYGDTDSQGHVNNAAFTTFLETGRTELLLAVDVWKDVRPVYGLVNSNINLMAEINWPGTVEIGTGIKKIGNSSITFAHGLYQNGQMVALAETIIVQMDEKTRKSKPLSHETREALEKFLIS